MEVITGPAGHVLGYLHRSADFDAAERTEVCPAAALLQVAAKHETRQRYFRAHRHLPQPRATEGTSEAWIVISGSAAVSIGDDAGHVPWMTIVLHAGDCYVSVAGVHALRLHAPETRIYEIKNGPYNGQAADKAWCEK